jgi:hypothetical protein
MIPAREAKKWRKEHPNVEPCYAESEIDQPSIVTGPKFSSNRSVGIFDYRMGCIFPNAVNIVCLGPSIPLPKLSPPNFHGDL